MSRSCPAYVEARKIWLEFFTSGAKARIHSQTVIAALEALRHPKSELISCLRRSKLRLYSCASHPRVSGMLWRLLFRTSSISTDVGEMRSTL